MLGALIALPLGLPLVVGLVLVSPQDPLEDIPALETKHYQLIFDMPQKRRDDWARLAECAWTAYAKELGQKPKSKPGKRPIVRFYRDRHEWLRGMERDQEFPLPGFNYVFYSRKQDTLYLHDEANTYHGRKMFLYGLFLQFHVKLKSKNQYLGQEWFITGMADALSTHRWDGEQLELGARMPLMENNRASLGIARGLLQRLADGELSSEDLSDWDVRWALSSFLLFGEGGKYRKLFHKSALGKSGSMLLGRDFMSGIGDVKAIVEQMGAWVRGRALALEPVWGTWDDEGLWLTGRPLSRDSSAVALGGLQCRTISAKITPLYAGEVGLVLDWIDPESYTLAVIRDMSLVIVQVSEDGSVELGWAELPASRAKAVELRAELDAYRVKVFVAGKLLGSWPVEAQRLGLYSREGKGLFAELELE